MASSGVKVGSGCWMGRKLSGVGGESLPSNPFAAKLFQSKCEYIVGSWLLFKYEVWTSIIGFSNGVRSGLYVCSSGYEVGAVEKGYEL